MTYTISSSERLRKSAADAETKALLYLMNFHEDHDEIHYFIVDFFNDLTGMDRMSDKLWDIQSKGASNSSPKALGKELVTLFKNFVSEFEFDNFILFAGGVSNTVRIDSTKKVFKIDNIEPNGLKKLKEGLLEECKVKTYINDSDITTQKINEFLNNVLFVIDDKEPSEYVKSIIKNHIALIPSKDELSTIFNEIRKIQSDKKNTSPVEGISITSTDQSLNYYRHLTSGQIKMLVISRIINRNPFDRGCPIHFVDIFNSFPVEIRQEALEDCKLAFSRALFNKNTPEEFWMLFNETYNKIIEHPDKNVEEIFGLLNRNIKQACPDFDVLSLKYFIATVKEGLQNDY
ncbi:hypothetical protein HCJ21_10670 [Listeria seeligeri]|uniref:hypothetical protein n=1 Tax=Listeria seeligeri TaxID=1640 RepID=UPI001629AA65|nr:hypothetical protein [Listeria seeligeri]MBC1579683.1 hypothetical protein [Listeria seeligeri]MBC1597241.1 hypothetical protein [Listeria seeligeri]MBC1599717.1 hypothetical protein [Listeria seeligeri]MBC2044348.1 hypothetical protein [Listeria seeligeri]MBC2051522.1 hypothetical protein [Listeria seeligeri]